jgi:hypothetical protein
MLTIARPAPTAGGSTFITAFAGSANATQHRAIGSSNAPRMAASLMTVTHGCYRATGGVRKHGCGGLVPRARLEPGAFAAAHNFRLGCHHRASVVLNLKRVRYLSIEVDDVLSISEQVEL